MKIEISRNTIIRICAILLIVPYNHINFKLNFQYLFFETFLQNYPSTKHQPCRSYNKVIKNSMPGNVEVEFKWTFLFIMCSIKSIN